MRPRFLLGQEYFSAPWRVLAKGNNMYLPSSSGKRALWYFSLCLSLCVSGAGSHSTCWACTTMGRAQRLLCPTQRTRHFKVKVKYWALQSRGHSIFQLRKTEALASYRFVLRGKSPLKHHSLFWTGGGNSRKCWGGGNVDDKTELPHSEIFSHWGVSAPHTLQNLQELRVRKPLLGKFTEPMSCVVHSPAPHLGPTPNGKVVFLRKQNQHFSPLPSIESIEKRRGG